MMSPNRETQLWYWFLHSGAIPTARAKQLLDAWRVTGTTLETVLASLPASALRAGLNSEEVQALRPPWALETITALRWNEPLYPKGLLDLELKIRPALLFYRGDPHLLERPVLEIAVAPLDETTTPLLQEALSQILGEAVLPATLRGSAQAATVLEELTDSEGDVLLFTRQGLETVELTKTERRLLDEGRMLLLSPLSPKATANGKWDASLLQVELAIARNILWVSSTPPTAPANNRRTLWLTSQAPEVMPLPGLQMTDEPADLSLWLLQNGAANAGTAERTTITDAIAATPLPPLPPTEALHILERGGAIPEALRRRLLGQ